MAHLEPYALNPTSVYTYVPLACGIRAVGTTNVTQQAEIFQFWSVVIGQRSDSGDLDSFLTETCIIRWMYKIAVVFFKRNPCGMSAVYSKKGPTPIIEAKADRCNNGVCPFLNSRIRLS